LKASIYTYTL